MPRKRRRLQTAQTPRRANDAAVVTLVVRRGALRRFDRLARAAQHLHCVVEWDRRVKERRVTSHAVAEERRQAERRRTPPFTWIAADFVVVTSLRAAQDGQEP